MPLVRQILLTAAVSASAIIPLPAQIYADFDVGRDSEFSFTVQLDITTGLWDTGTAPRLAANFIRLAEGSTPWIDTTAGLVREDPFFDGLTFYNNTYNNRTYFGSRTGTGTDSPGWIVQDEFRSDATPLYALYMDNDGPNTNGCRYFISIWNDPALVGKYPRMGHVLQISPAFPGLNGKFNVFNLCAGPTDTINSVTIRRVGALAIAFDEHSWNLPDLSASSFKIKRDGETYRLLWADEPGFAAKYFVSEDLLNWFPSEGYDPPGATTLGVDITPHIAISPKAFYRGASIHYPDWPAADLKLEHAGLQFSYLSSDPARNNLIRLFFGVGGIGTWDKYYQPYGSTGFTFEGSGSLSATWTATRPFLGELTVFPTGGLADYTFRMHFDYHLPVETVIDRFEGFTTNPAPPNEYFKGTWTYTFYP